MHGLQVVPGPVADGTGHRTLESHRRAPSGRTQAHKESTTSDLASTETEGEVSPQSGL
jgi:hypothetical protein